MDDEAFRKHEAEAQAAMEELQRMEKELLAVEEVQRKKANEMRAQLPRRQEDDDDGHRDDDADWDDEPSSNGNGAQTAVAMFDYQAGKS